MKKQRLFSAVLAVLLCATACGGDGSNLSNKVETGDNTSVQNISGETDRSQIKDNLPEKDYTGETFTVLYRNEWEYEFIAEEENGDIVTDAVYKRNRAVEDRFGLEFDFYGLPGTWNSKEFSDAINNSVLGGDSEYDLIVGYQADMVNPAMNNYFMNIYDLEYIDTEAPWWSEQCNSSLSVNGKLFMTTGDIALTLWDNMYVFYFNKLLAEEYKVPNIYDIVDSGEWTIDKLYEISTTVSQDLDGSTTYDENDLYGFLTTMNNHTRNWIVAGQTPILKQNTEGLMEPCLVTERTQGMLDKLLKLYYSNSTYYKNDALGEPNSTEEPIIFTSNRALFMSGYLGNSNILRSMDADFGIIPYPKYDEEQEAYYTTAHNSVSMMCFPVTVRDEEMSAIITEALCAESYRNVIPQYYERVLKAKGARDDESAAMIDIIRDSLIFDFGWVHSMSLDRIGQVMQDLVSANNSGLASYWATKENKVLTGLETVNEAYSKGE